MSKFNFLRLGFVFLEDGELGKSCIALLKYPKHWEIKILSFTCQKKKIKNKQRNKKKKQLKKHCCWELFCSPKNITDLGKLGITGHTLGTSEVCLLLHLMIANTFPQVCVLWRWLIRSRKEEEKQEKVGGKKGERGKREGRRKGQTGGRQEG